MNASVYWTRSKFSDVTNLLAVTENAIAGSEHSAKCIQGSTCFSMPLLRVDFRYLTKYSKLSPNYITKILFLPTIWGGASHHQCPQAVLMSAGYPAEPRWPFSLLCAINSDVVAYDLPMIIFCTYHECSR